MNLTFFYLTDDRRHFTFPHFLKMINESTKKSEFILLILTHTNDSQFYNDLLVKTNINFNIVKFDEHNNYLQKVNYAIDFSVKNNIPYMMKCDNDIFIKAQTLDYMIENLNILDNSNYLTLGPVLTSGIPGIEYFKEQFLDENAQELIEQMFLKTSFYNRDGAVYTHLNKYTTQSLKWNKNDFFNGVKQNTHHYKGIHPIRVNEESLQFLNDYIIKHKTRFLENKPLSIITDDNSAYLCNSIFCIKTNIYQKIVNDTSLYVDPFEEVPLNKYSWNNNMKHLFIKNGFAIHMYYNWKQNHMEHEKIFVSNFFDKL
jgi:hypothetical protein